MVEDLEINKTRRSFPRLKLILMFLFLWFILVGIAYAISTYFGYGTYSWVCLAIISIFIVILNLVTYFFSDKMVLRAYKAKFVTERELRGKFGTTEPLAFRDPDFGLVRIRAFGKFAYKYAKE